MAATSLRFCGPMVTGRRPRITGIRSVSSGCSSLSFRMDWFWWFWLEQTSLWQDVLFHLSFSSWLYNESPVKDTIVTNDRFLYSCKISHSSLNTECQLNRWSRTLSQQSSLRIFWDQVGIWHSLQAWRLLHLHRQVPLSYRFHSYLWHIMRYKWIDNWLSGVSEFWTIAVAAEVTQEHYRKSHVKKERNVEIYEKYDPGTIQGYCRPISGRMLWLWTGEKALAFVFVLIFFV